MHLTWIRRRLAGEDGFTMLAVIGAMALVTLMVGAALAATNGDLRLVRRDLSSKQAYAAAQAGIADYVFHLTNDVGYWTRCDDVPGKNTGQSAVNLDGANPLRSRPVPEDSSKAKTLRLELVRSLIERNLGWPDIEVVAVGRPELVALQFAEGEEGARVELASGIFPINSRTPVLLAQTAAGLDETHRNSANAAHQAMRSSMAAKAGRVPSPFGSPNIT